MAKNTDIAKTNNDLPAYLQDYKHESNNDGFGADDVIIPQIKLLQGTSEEVTAFDDAQPGVFWHTGLDEALGTDVEFVICSRRKKYLLQAPLDDGQGVLARADDAITWDRLGSWQVKVDKKTTVEWAITDLNVEASGLTEWGSYDPTEENEREKKPAATLFYEYLVLIPGRLDIGPAVISLARSAIRKAKKGLNDKIQLHDNNGRPLQSLKFLAATASEQNSANQDFFNWAFKSGGFADEDTYNMANEVKGLLTTYQVQDEGSVVDDVATAPVDDGKF